MTTTVVLLFVALAVVGVGYGLWSKTLYIEGTVGTGSLDAVFVDPFTDDDGKVNETGLDSTDVGDCAISVNDPAGSCDPKASGHNVARKDKDVGTCTVEYAAQDPTGETLVLTIDNAYPSYYCTVFFDVRNTGSIPVKIFELAVVGPGITAGHVTAHWTDLQIGQQIEPNQIVPGDLDLHVEQSAPQGGTITLIGKIQLVQWNEFFGLGWDKCSDTNSEPCWDDPDVAFSGNTVVMGKLGEPDSVASDAQNSSVHGGSALLPVGSSYDVTFQYHVCTWDSYNANVGGGTGHWDSFSVSSSSAPYWALALTDPVNGDPGIDVGFIWGGVDFDDGILECNDGTSTVSLDGFGAATYLNAVLDTGTLPDANHIHPSYGTITIEKIVVNP
jgi:hypothetical protein